MADRMIAPLTLCAGPVLFAVALALTWADSRWPDRAVFVCVYGFWLLMCHTCRLLPHLLSAPGAPSTAPRPPPAAPRRPGLTGPRDVQRTRCTYHCS